MKKFSTNWKGSKKSKKQRKYTANAPLHLKKKLLSANLAKNLREKYKKRNVELRKGDSVKIMRGKFKGKTGKVTSVKTNLLKIYIEGIQKKKQDGSMVDVPLKASNLQITELNTDDKKRFGTPKAEPSKEKTETPKKERKPETKEDKKMEKKK